jgi:hypothetical protein
MSANRRGRLATQLVSRVEPAAMTPGQVAYEFRKQLDAGVPIIAAGPIRKDPFRLLSMGYTPRHRFQLFDATFYLSNLRFDLDFRFFVAFVHLPGDGRSRPRRGAFHPRVLYKDQSLVWRCPSHCIRSEGENWIGKGALKPQRVGGEEIWSSAEETTNLPLEIQATLDELSRRGGRVRRDDAIVSQILRNAPDDRFEPYEDWSAPRRRTMSNPRNLVNRGREVAWFERENDPRSLRFEPGFEPDFRKGVVETSLLKSRIYGGEVRKLRILSKNGVIQYQFVAAPRQVWIIPPQTLTTEITSYGVRTVDVEAAEDLCVPGYEYHFMDESEDPPQLYTQIPDGFAGQPSEVDPARSDASPWIEELPVIREFRRVLGFSRPRTR